MPIYLDHAAPTPILPVALDAMTTAFARWANPSSPHADGRRAKAALEEARARIKAALGWSGDILFTSGASEAIALAIAQSRADRILAGATEHASVLPHVPAESRLPVDRRGHVHIERARRALGDREST